MMRLKHFIFLSCLSLGVLVPLLSAPARGANLESATQVCLNDYYSFVLSVRTDEMRRAYFTDMFTMSYCQINDVLPLYDEYEAIKDDFRADSSRCGMVDDYEGTIAEYQFEMKRILLEVYFIRNVKVTARNTTEIESIEARTETVLKTLKEDMEAKFITDEQMVTQKEFDIMFAAWTSQYEDTILSYSACNEGPLVELSESWTNFQETLNSLDFEIDKPERKGFWNVVKPDVDASGVADGFNEGVQSVTDSWNKFMDNFRHGEETKSEQEKEDEEKSAEQGSTPAEPLTFDDYFEELTDDTSTDDVYEASNRRMSEYELLYGEVGAVTTTRSVIILDQINQTVINNNVKDFPAILEALDDIYGKQCSG